VADKNIMRIEWASADGDARDAALQRLRDEMSPSAAPLKRSDLRTLDREEIEVLVKRGRDFILNGDLAAARLVLRRAANGGDAQAALLLGTTFDPATFEKLQVIGAAPDPDEARNWYQRAIDLGSVEAERRLAPLARGKH
jgi:TPR repeat protein